MKKPAISSPTRLEEIFTLLIGLLTLAAAGAGVFVPGFYEGIVDPRYATGTITADVVSLICVPLLAVCVWLARRAVCQETAPRSASSRPACSKAAHTCGIFGNRRPGGIPGRTFGADRLGRIIHLEPGGGPIPVRPRHAPPPAAKQPLRRGRSSPKTG